jgi:hypothetical protein
VGVSAGKRPVTPPPLLVHLVQRQVAHGVAVVVVDRRGAVDVVEVLLGVPPDVRVVVPPGPPVAWPPVCREVWSASSSGVRAVGGPSAR